MRDAYDIYIVAQVERMKTENAELRCRLRETVRENALLNEKLNRYERARAYWSERENEIYNMS